MAVECPPKRGEKGDLDERVEDRRRRVRLCVCVGSSPFSSPLFFPSLRNWISGTTDEGGQEGRPKPQTGKATHRTGRRRRRRPFRGTTIQANSVVDGGGGGVDNAKKTPPPSNPQDEVAKRKRRREGKNGGGRGEPGKPVVPATERRRRRKGKSAISWE